MSSSSPTSATLGPRDQRYFESYLEGAHYLLGTFALSEEEIIEFARRYDPQPFHLDRSAPGGIIASGWHTLLSAMRLIAENYLSGVAALPSPGVNEIRWLRPVYPNQEVTVTAELTEARRSASKPDRGLLMTTMRGGDEDGNDLFQFSAVSFVLCRGVIS